MYCLSGSQHQNIIDHMPLARFQHLIPIAFAFFEFGQKHLIFSRHLFNRTKIMPQFLNLVLNLEERRSFLQKMPPQDSLSTSLFPPEPPLLVA